MAHTAIILWQYSGLKYGRVQGVQGAVFEFEFVILHNEEKAVNSPLYRVSRCLDVTCSNKPITGFSNMINSSYITFKGIIIFTIFYLWKCTKNLQFPFEIWTIFTIL